MKTKKLTNNLISYERGESLLLLNGSSIKPLLISRGKEYVISQLRDPSHIEDSKLIDFLVLHDILVEDGQQTGCESPRINNRGIEFSDKTPGVSLYLLLAQNCNLNCVYCLNGEKSYQKGHVTLMDEKTAFTGIDRIVQPIQQGGTFDLILFGGEPLMNWRLGKKVITYCETDLKARRPDLKIKYHLTSNLTLFPQDLIEWVRKYSIGILCNIDGDQALHDATRPFRQKTVSSHAASVRNIKKLRNAGISVGLRSTVTTVNQHHIVGISLHHKKLDGAASAFVAVNAVNSDNDILDKALLPDPTIFAEALRSLVNSNVWDKRQIFPFNRYLQTIRPNERNVWACGASLGNTPVLDINGDVYACIYLVGMERYKLGNVHDDSAPYPDPLVVKRMMEIIDIDNSSDCKACNVRYICGGGCPVGRLLIKDNPKADADTIKYTHDIACKVNKAMIEESLWYYAEKAEQEKERLSEDSAGAISHCGI